MIDVIRSFRLGIINLFGIVIPGVFLLATLLYGIFFPVLIVVAQLLDTVYLSETKDTPTLTYLSQLFEANAVFIILGFLITAYIVGYLVRLMTVDQLDEVSARKIRDRPSKVAVDEARSGPGLYYDPDDKTDNYPYKRFRQSLEDRGMKKLAKMVKWSPGIEMLNKSSETPEKLLNKEHINMMKIEIAALKPELSAIIESNEAHIRLLNGIWYAIGKTRKVIMVGVTFCTLVFVVGSIVKFAPIASTLRSKPDDLGQLPLFLLYGIALLALWLGMQWVRNQIEILFHHLRYREVTQILMCAAMARKKYQHPWNRV